MTLAFWGPEEVTVATDGAFAFVDLTDDVARLVAAAGIDAGSAQVFCPHTSCGLAITELEDGLHEDVEGLLERLAPTAGTYAHDDMGRRYQNLEPDERRNGWSHLRGLLVTQPAVVLPVAGGRLALGRWQRLFLMELDGPRPARRVVVQAWGRARG